MKGQGGMPGQQPYFPFPPPGSRPVRLDQQSDFPGRHGKHPGRFRHARLSGASDQAKEALPEGSAASFAALPMSAFG